jgi:hypothetical protein
VYDLDKKNPSMVHLIEPMHKLDANRTLLMSVDIDRSSKTLSFNLVLTTNIMRGSFFSTPIHPFQSLNHSASFLKMHPVTRPMFAYTKYN